VLLPEEEIGRRAAEVLHEMRIGKRPMEDNEEIMLSMNVTEGQTLGPVASEVVTVS
jgi:hypothetical protein